MALLQRGGQTQLGHRQRPERGSTPLIPLEIVVALLEVHHRLARLVPLGAQVVDLALQRIKWS